MRAEVLALIGDETLPPIASLSLPLAFSVISRADFVPDVEVNRVPIL